MTSKTGTVRAVLRALAVVMMVSGCLPQVGPLIDLDAGSTGGGAGGGTSASGGGSGGGTAIDGGSDGGTVSCTDGKTNGTETDLDCGGSCPPCANASSCVSALDCVSGVCSASHCIAPVNPCGTFAGCTTFTDLTTQNAIVRFPGGNERYLPPCIRVRFGQSVTFQGGDFGSHPLDGACAPQAMPFHASTGSTYTVTFDKALGVFGYYCTQHGSANGAGMAGAIEVVR